MESLLQDVRDCRICEPYLVDGCRPVLRASKNSRIAIIGQAPGRKVHASGIPWDDQSGKNLRRWMNISDEAFYNPEIYAIIPMGFCFPGSGKSGDLPPRPECAPQWHAQLFAEISGIDLVLLIGQYAQRYYLKKAMKKNLTETVKSFREYEPRYLPLPHPSPRNLMWQRRNPWFEEDVIPYLQQRIQQILV